MVAKPEGYELPEAVRSPFSIGGALYRIASFAWERGVTPGVMARTLGPLTRNLTRGYTDRRLHASLGVPKEDTDAFEPYIYEILGAKGSGEVRTRFHLVLLPVFRFSSSR
jgi:hypothetical protein